MLYNFLFSINAVAPLFAIILLGYALKKTGFISDEFVTVGNKIIFYIALPASVFMTVYTVDITHLLDWRFAVFAAGASLVSFFAIWAIAALFIKDKPILGAFAGGAFRGNFVFLGIPLLISLTGAIGEARAALILAFVFPVYNICTVLLLAACSDSGKKVSFKSVGLSIVKNPFIIAIVLAVGLQLFGVYLPFAISETVRHSANMATALALICLGAAMKYHGFDARFKYAFVASLIKVIVLPILFGLVGFFMGFDDYDIVAFVILGGIPSAIAGYAMVVQMGGDVYIAGTIVVISTLLSAFTLTVFVYVMRVLGLVG